MYTNATPWALYCTEHGLNFLDDIDSDKGRLGCPISDCDLIAQYDEDLYDAWLKTGCKFCTKTGFKSPFIYDEKLGYVYCNAQCLKCWQRKCCIHGCAALAKIKMYLVVNETEYLVPTVFCLTHSQNLPVVPDDSMYKFICSIAQQNNQDIPERNDCHVKVRRY